MPPQHPPFFFFLSFWLLIWMVSRPIWLLNLVSSIFYAIVVNSSLFNPKFTLMPLPSLALVSLNRALIDWAYSLASLKRTSSSSVLSILLPTTAKTTNEGMVTYVGGSFGFEFLDPVFHDLEGVFTGDIVDAESDLGFWDKNLDTSVVDGGYGFVLFLSGCVPDLGKGKGTWKRVVFPFA